MQASHLARSERSGLCDALIQAGPGAPTLCEGWQTRGILLGGTFAKLTDRSMAVANRTFGYVGVVAKLRSGPPLLWRPVDELANVVEFFVHTEDVRRAVPGWEARNDSQLDAALWSRLARMAKLMTRRLRGAGLELESPEGERIVAHRGEPRAVLSGGPQELVLYLCGRPQAAKVSLSGPDEAQQALRTTRFGI
jgi:uncharacterized protein (TIGR03085 family)